MAGPLDIRNATPESVIGKNTGNGLLSNLNPDEMRRLELLYQQQKESQTKDPEKKNLFQKIGKKLTDPTVLTGLAAAFDSVTASPNPALQKRYGDMVTLDKLQKQGNQTATYLRNQGKDELATMIEANPSMAGELMKAYASNQMKQPYSRKGIGTVQVDPSTGQQYMIEYDPNVAGGVRRVDIEGATSLTPSQKITMEANAAAVQADRQAAQEYGQELFGTFGVVDKSIDNLQRIGDLSSEGARTGFFTKYLPAFDENTVELRQIANKMGIDIINSATFGALSATELRLALSTAFDQNLSGQALQNYVDRKVKAQRKLRNELLDQSRVLMSGRMTLSEFADNIAAQDKEAREIASYDFAKDGVKQNQWDSMNLEQRKAFIAAGQN
jgi:hypothetical protein